MARLVLATNPYHRAVEGLSRWETGKARGAAKTLRPSRSDRHIRTAFFAAEYPPTIFFAGAAVVTEKELQPMNVHQLESNRLTVLAAGIRAEHEATASALRRGLDHAMAAGGLLIEAEAAALEMLKRALESTAEIPQLDERRSRCGVHAS
jgi:hypothetical protein